MSKRVLVVEDHDDNRQISAGPARLDGYEMMEVENGEEALMPSQVNGPISS